MSGRGSGHDNARSLADVRTVVFDGHSSEAVAAVQSLGRLGANITVVAGDQRALALRSRYARQRIVVDRGDPQYERLMLASVNGAYDVVVLSTEVSLVRGSAQAVSASARQRCALAPQVGLELMLNKHMTTIHAQSVGISVPRSVLIAPGDSITRELHYPVVLKPVRSKVIVDGRLRHLPVCIARNETQRRKFLDTVLQLLPVQQQEFAPGRDLAVAVVYDRSQLRWAYAYERLRTLPADGGIGTYRKTVEVTPSLRSAVERLLDPLDWHGPAMIEFRVPLPGPPVLIEVNPRLWGSVPLAIAAGADFPAALAALALGTPLPSQPRYRIPLFGRNIVGELQRLRSSRPAQAPVTLSAPGALRELGNVLLGRERWDHCSLTDPAVAAAVARNALGVMRSAR